MSWLTNLEHMFQTTMADIEAVLMKIVQGAEVVEKDLENGLNFLASHAPQIATDLTAATQMAETVIAATPGAAQNAIVTKAIQEANVAVQGLNAFANAANQGNKAQALAQAYVAVQTAQAAVSSAKASSVAGGVVQAAASS